MHRGRPNHIGTLKCHKGTSQVTVLINGPFHKTLYRFREGNTIITMNLTQCILNKGTIQIRGILRGRPKNIGTLKYKLMTLNTYTCQKRTSKPYCQLQQNSSDQCNPPQHKIFNYCKRRKFNRPWTPTPRDQKFRYNSPKSQSLFGDNTIDNSLVNILVTLCKIQQETSQTLLTIIKMQDTWANIPTDDVPHFEALDVGDGESLTKGVVQRKRSRESIRRRRKLYKVRNRLQRLQQQELTKGLQQMGHRHMNTMELDADPPININAGNPSPSGVLHNRELTSPNEDVQVHHMNDEVGCSSFSGTALDITSTFTTSYQFDTIGKKIQDATIDKLVNQRICSHKAMSHNKDWLYKFRKKWKM